jgi:nucleotide-binding universal stress UspA family protein
MIPESPVVIGLDDTEASMAALSWAAAEAAANHAPLLVVHVLDPRGTAAVYSHAEADAGEEPPNPVERIKELIEWAEVGAVRPVFEVGVPGRVLVHQSRGARMLVLGQARRHHRFEGEEYVHGPALGPVARACVALAQCPVVVVPEPAVDAAAAHSEESARHAPVLGARAIYPFQGRIPVAHQ